MFKLFTSLIVLLLTLTSLFILNERQTFDVRTLVQIDPLPHTKELMEKQKYAQAEEYLSYYIEYDYVKNNPHATELLEKIQHKRASDEYQTSKILEGILKGKSDEPIGQTSAFASDFLVIGDIRDLYIEGMHYINNEKVDRLMVALSSLGLISTAGMISSKGATVPVKDSVLLLKYARRTKKIPQWLQRKLIHQIELAKETKSLKKIQELLTPVHGLYRTIGLNQTLNLLSKSRNLKELTLLSKFATRFGSKTQVLLKTTHNTALKSIDKMPNVSTKDFLYASTYGERGLKALEKLGAHKFMQRVGFHSHLAKTTYKGNFNALFNALLKNIPNMVLYAMSLFGLLYFARKFFILSKKLF